MTTTRRTAILRAMSVCASLGPLGPVLSACGGGSGTDNGSIPGWAGQGTTTTQWMVARSNGTTYPVYIYTPPDSAKDRATMPVVYSLDGDIRFLSLATLVDTQQARVILVGIGNDAMRGRDYVPVNSCTPGGGGQAAYFDFIRLDVIPFVESTVGGDPAQRVLWGHSHGGTFVYYAMFAQAASLHTFHAYLPADASIPCLPDTADAWESNYAAANTTFPARVYVSYAANDNSSYVASIQSRHYGGLVLGSGFYNGGHVGMIPASFVDSLTFALASH